MYRRLLLIAPLLLSAHHACAQDAPAGATAAKADVTGVTASADEAAAKSKQAKGDTGAKTLSGMSILGNQEAPKALVIVPWKSSQLGDSIGVSRTLDDSRRPVDKDVFMRELAYYEIRAASK